MKEYLPQILVIVWLVFAITSHALKHGQPTTFDVYGAIFRSILWVSLLYWGGFWK